MPGRKEVFQNAMNKGHSAAWDQDWEQAAKYYLQALQEFPDNAQALTSLALAYYQTQQFNEALQYYLKAAEVSAGDPVPREKASEIYERLGSIERASENSFAAAELYARSRDLDKAIECWTRVVRLTPEHLQAHSRLALVHDRLGNKRLAVGEYIAVASLLQHARQKEKALQAIQRAQQLMPENPQITQVTAMIKANRMLPTPTRPKGATGPLRMAQVRQLDAMDESESESPVLDPISEARQKALTELAGMLFESEDEDLSELSSPKGFQAIVKGVGSVIANQQYDHDRILLHLSQVVDYQTRGVTDEAVKELEKAVSLGLEHPAAYYDLGLLQVEEGRLESALRNLRKAAVVPEYALGAYLLMGKVHRQMGNLSEASVDYLRALRIADAMIVPANQADELRQLYDPMIEAQSKESSEETHQRLCDNVEELLLEPGWQERLSSARKQLPKPEDGGPLLPLAEILTASTSSHIVESLANINRMAKQGRWRSAIDEAYWAMQHAPTYLPLHVYVAEMLLQLGFVSEAVNKLAVVARTYHVRGEPEQGITILRRLVELAPMDLNARTRLIDILVNAQEYTQAAEEYIQLASVYLSRAELDKARQTYTEALRMAQHPSVDSRLRVKILHLMADIDLQSLDWRQALRVYEQVRTLAPGDEKARTNLVNLHLRLAQHQEALEELDDYLGYLVEKRQISQAFSFLEALVVEQPEVMPIRFRLAELYRQAGRLEQAIGQYDIIVEKLMVSGDHSGAIKILNTVLKLNPPNANEYKQVLNQLLQQAD
ncbi:MAG: tetratricopeptide repeat protein [Anaerolineales bacterium]